MRMTTSEDHSSRIFVAHFSAISIRIYLLQYQETCLFNRFCSGILLFVRPMKTSFVKSFHVLGFIFKSVVNLC